MILITVKFPIRTDKLSEWKELSSYYAEAVNAIEKIAMRYPSNSAGVF